VILAAVFFCIRLPHVGEGKEIVARIFVLPVDDARHGTCRRQARDRVIGAHAGLRATQTSSSESAAECLPAKTAGGQPLPENSRLQNKSVVDAGPTPDWEHVYKVVDALDALALETGKTIPQLALNWLLQRPTISTLIIGARDEKQLRANLASTGWNLTPDQIAKLDAASAVPLAYPYWHQIQFDERNPFPVPQTYGS